MSEKLDEFIPEELDEVEEVGVEDSIPEKELISEEDSALSEDSLPTFEEQENLVSQAPTDIYSEKQQLDDEIYQQSLTSRGKENFEDSDLAERKEDLLNLMIEISEHENGAYHVENFINHIIHEKGDFIDGGLYDGIDVTELLNPLKEVFPDIDDFEEEALTTPPRLVSPVADRLKTFLAKEINKKEKPIESFLFDGLSATGQTFKEILTVPYVLGKGLIDTVAKVLDFQDWVNDQPALVQLVYKMGTVHSSSNELSNDDRKTFYEYSNYYFPPANKPQTILGQLALSGAEFGLAYATGRAIYSNIASPIKSMYPRLAAMLETPGANVAVKEVLGGTLITTPEERLSTALQMMGVTGEGKFGPWVDYIAGSPDDNIFEERFKSFIDSVYTGVGLATIAPLVMMTGKGAWYASRPAIKGSKEKGKQALAFGASYFDRIFRNYPVEEAMRLDLGGPKVVKSEELRRIQEITKQQILKSKSKEETKNLISKGLKVVGKNVKETSAVKDMLKSQGIKIEDDAIFPLVQHKGIKSFLQKVDNANLDDIINNSVRPINESLSYQEIVENQSKYFPGLFNVKNVSGKNRKQAIAEAGKMLQDYLDNSIKSHGETIIDASKIRGDLAHMVGEENVGKYLMDYAGTTDALPGTMLAIKQYMVEESIPFRASSVKVQKAKAALNKGEITKKQYKKDLLEFYIATYKFMDVLEADVRIGGNIARALEARKIPVGGTDTLLDTIINSAKDGGVEGEKVLEKLSAAITKFESPEQLYAAYKNKRGKLFLTFEMIKSLAVGGLLSSPKTLAAVPLGLSTFIATKSVENYISASINSASKLIYKGSKKLKETGLGSGKQWETWAGKGEGMSFKQANAYQFGMMQALLEVFGGTGYFQKNFNLTAKESSEAVTRSAPVEGARVFRTLDLGGPSGKEHEMIKIAGPSATKLNLKPLGLGEWTMAKGVNSENFERLLGIEDIPELKGKGGDFFRFLVNSVGTVSSFNSRTIMAQDGFFGTILERAEMHMRAMRRAEERLRGSNGKEFTEKELAEEYFHVVKNYPPDAALDGYKARKIGLMQENKEFGLVSNIERFKNGVSDDPNLLTNLLHHKGNITRTYVASKFSFIRTMANIYKQTLTERGIGKLAGTLLKGSDRRKFVNNEVFRQETLAKIGTGSLMVWAGYGLGQHWFSTNETEVYMEGVKAAKRENQYMKLVTGEGYGPVIKMRDLNTGDITNLPLERLDMAKAPLILGAIWATREAQAFEALQKLEENSTEKIEGLRLLWELNTNFRLALGDFVTSLPMAQGAKDTVTNLIPGFSPDWDPSKEVTDFYGFLNPKHSFLSSLRGNLSKIQTDGIRYTKAAKQKTKNISLGDNWRKQKYVSDTGIKLRVGSPVKGTPIDKFSDGLHWMNLLDDLARRVSWVDFRNPDNPIIGNDVAAMIGPEGKPIKYLPEETMSDLRRAMEILAIPWSPQVQARSNTSDLIIAFDISYENPQDWDVFGTKYNLTPEQRTEWAIEAGLKNARSFKSKHWQDKILEERAGGFDINTASGLRKRTFVANHITLQIKQNRQEALFEIATKRKNQELFNYLMAKKQQKKSPPLEKFDAL